MGDRFIQHQEITGYSDAVVYGWAPVIPFDQLLAAALGSPKLRESITRNNALLANLKLNKKRFRKKARMTLADIATRYGE